MKKAIYILKAILKERESSIAELKVWLAEGETKAVKLRDAIAELEETEK